MNRGSLILIGVLLIGILAFVCLTLHWPKMERDLLARVSEELAAADMSWALVQISGRDLTLRGMAPTSSAIDKARTLTAGVRGVRRVVPDFDIPPAAVAGSSADSDNALVPLPVDGGTSSAQPPIDDEAVDLAVDTPQPLPKADPATAASIPADDTSAVPEPALSATSCQQQLDSTLRGQRIQFAKNSADIVAGSFALLDTLAEIVQRCPDVRIEVSGHTDSGGPEDWNQRLSGLRAQAVVDHLRARGIPRSRLQADGRGSSEPIADNQTDAGRVLNRRIEFKVLSKET